MKNINEFVLNLKLNDETSSSGTVSIKTRDDIDDKFKWNIEDMYPNHDLWQRDVDTSLVMSSEFIKLKGKIIDSAQSLFDAFTARDAIWQKIEKAFVYSRMRRDEDNRNELYQGMCDKAQSAISKISANMSFFTPELLESSKDVIDEFIDQLPQLSQYKFLIDDMFREKEHSLSQKEENILAQMGELMSATNNIFTMLNNADLTFGQITDKNGESIEITHGNYISYMENQDKNVRKQAYEAMYTSYKNLINTISTTYNFNTKTDAVYAKIRKYPSSRAAALSSDNIDEVVYDNLISVVEKNLPTMHKYMAIRKKMLGLETLNMTDVYVPLVKIPQNPTSIPGEKLNFQQAVDIMCEALAPLGEKYVSDVKAGVSAGWIDVYENQGKTSGAYSFGSYDSMPYILLNFASSLKDVFTLVHEMGHSMHSFYTRATQPYTYGDHSIFTAEVASTVNENLLVKYLLSKEENTEMRKYLINYHIEEFRTTVFRQTMFAEFEKWSHEQIEKGEPLTAQSMCAYYLKLNQKYFGNEVEMDDLIQYEWARIPHFYNAFYVYKYATGYSAAAAISDIILNEGPDDYLKFLTTGSSNHPIPLLKIAGVDMSGKEPIERAMKVFRSLVEQLDELS